MDFSPTIEVKHGYIYVAAAAPESAPTTRYAYYLYEKGQGLVEKRRYSDCATCLFRPFSPGSYYVKVFVRAPSSDPNGGYDISTARTGKVSVPGKNTTPSIYPTISLRYEELDDLVIPPRKSIIYNIAWNGVHYEFLIRHKPESTQALVLGTGAVGEHPRPYFARNSWAAEFPCTAIYYSDPTSYMGECHLGWGYGTNQRWYLEDIAILTLRILRKLKIQPEDTLFYGSSGGGFTSMLLASMFHSRATVINPQFFIENYRKLPVGQMKAVCLKAGETLIPQRSSISAMFEAVNYFPVLHIFQNILSSGDISLQLSPFLAKASTSKLSTEIPLRIDLYFKEGGHNAMPDKNVCIEQVTEDLACPLPASARTVPPVKDGFLNRFLAEFYENK